MALHRDKSGLDVMIVEDDWITAADLSASLTQLGYFVVANVASGEEAIDRAGELQPDIIIMDMRLRGAMDGLEAGWQIHETWGIPIVYVSAFFDNEICRRTHGNSIVYLRKPFQPDILRSALESVSCASGAF